jgi:hypothetical protein
MIGSWYQAPMCRRFISQKFVIFSSDNVASLALLVQGTSDVTITRTSDFPKNLRDFIRVSKFLYTLPIV